MSKYFSDEETTCHCGCGGNDINPVLLELLDSVREAYGGPLTLNCAYRCPAHNEEVGGVPNSQHVLGNAADVACPDGFTVDELAWYAEQAGADGIGKYYPDAGNFVHMDVRSGRVGDTYRWAEGTPE